MTATQIGALVCDAFGLAWWIAAAQVSGRPRLLLATGALVASVLCVLPFLREAQPRPSAPFQPALYGAAVVLEVAAILVCVGVLYRRGRRDLMAPWVSIIVGLHFIGLWAASLLSVFLVVAAGLVVSGAFAASRPLPAEEAMRRRLALTGFASAGVLWLACAATALL